MTRAGRLLLDFERKANGAAMGYVLAAAGAMAVAAAMLAQSTISRELERGEEAAPRVERAIETVLPPGVASEEEAIGGARAVAAQLAGPWESVMRALESVGEPDVALLALQPDVEARRLRIHAEARSLDSMLSYYRGLRRAHAFTEVFLAEHEIRNDDPQRPVRFSVVATWGRP